MNLRLQNLAQVTEDAVIGVNLGMNKTSQDPVEDYVKGIKRFSEFASYYVINLSRYFISSFNTYFT